MTFLYSSCKAISLYLEAQIADRWLCIWNALKGPEVAELGIILPFASNGPVPGRNDECLQTVKHFI